MIISLDELFEFHHEFISMIRWKLNQDEYEQAYNSVSFRLEKFHTIYLNSTTPLTYEMAYDSILGNILSKDKDFLIRQLRLQGNKEFFGRKQSISTNVEASIIYPKIVKKIIESWFNPDQDGKTTLIDVAVKQVSPESKNFKIYGRKLKEVNHGY